MNKTSDMSYSQVENESDCSEVDDNLEYEELYDSDLDQDYVVSTSDDDNTFQGFKKPLAKKKWRTSTPRKAATSESADDSTASSEPASSVVPPATPSTSRATPLSTPEASTSGARKRRRTEDQPGTIDFQRSTIASKHGFRWSCRPKTGPNIRIPARNIVRFCPGPVKEAQDANTPEKAMLLLLTDDMIDIIVHWTNKRIELDATKYKRQSGVVGPTEPAEVRALIGLLLFSGAQRDNHLSTREMWDITTGSPVYRTSMSEARFTFLINSLRFDDPETREARRDVDKFAPIRELWDMFIKNCEQMYVPNFNLTVDEQLLAFRGRCPFKIYIPNKPAKYGIKIVLICDNNSKYLLGAIPYLGKGGTVAMDGVNLGHHLTRELTRPYHQTNRNVTTDNWFSSVPLAAELLNKCGMTHVGTIKGNKSEIPEEMKDKKDRRPGSSAFLFTNEMTLVSYAKASTKTPKKLVLLTSTMHTQPVLVGNGKPEIIDFYNRTKGGVDCFDMMCALYSCGRRTKRWPMCVFYGMLNSMSINSWVIHSENLERTHAKRMERRKYIKELAMSLIRPWAEHCLTNPHLSRSLKTTIARVCDVPSHSSAANPGHPVLAESQAPMVRCAKCPRKDDRKSRHRCNNCGQPVCPRHIYPVCVDCIEKER